MLGRKQCIGSPASHQTLPGAQLPLHRCVFTAASRSQGCSSARTNSSRCRSSSKESPFLEGVQFHQPGWGGIETEQQFFGKMEADAAVGRFPKKLIPVWQDFYNNYRNAIVGSGVQGANELLASKIQATIADCVMLQLVQPYTFPSVHKRILEPYNYYEFGQRYVGALIDFEASVLGQPERWATIEAQLAAKHNVILLANHQTEADPGVFAHMLAASHPEMATSVVYVAGDRVITDPLSKPFSMGRNLFCVHSKKHINDIPELYQEKADTNRKTLVAMARRLNEGGALIWIAPSGGRDRSLTPDGVDFLPDPFDASAVELMRSLTARAKQPGHLYPMAMYSWPVMPPPKTVDKTMGERRLTNYTGVGISVAEELDVATLLAGIEDKEQQQKHLAAVAFEEVSKEYGSMMAAIKSPSARGPGTKFVQPWAKQPAMV
ncbi:MAG: hypothetical protein WDW36_009508 [Sanguina aurantia]